MHENVLGTPKLEGTMRKAVLLVFAALCVQPLAYASDISTPLSGLSFLVGQWGSAKGVVADTGGTSTGHSTFTVEADGALLLRRDHTDLFDKSGKSSGGFNQVMTIYADHGALRADYIDAQHVIHYGHVDIEFGHSAVFTSVAQADAPTFKLVYSLENTQTLRVTFSMAPPGNTSFQPIASGTLTKSP
jgi:hypothetical protein